MQLCDFRNALKIARFSSNPWGVVVNVYVQPRRPKERRQRPNETIHKVETSNFSSRFDVPVVIRREDVQPVPRPGATAKAHQKADQVVEGLLSLLGLRANETAFTLENRAGEGKQLSGY